ncbi:hypothetical protein JCM1841_002039 [Sporobolomyces salmonicolor]
MFLGFKKGQELAAAYASADLFAFPSFTETFGQVVSEAQASGLPVVGLRAEGVCDLVEHERTGLLLDLDDLVCPPPLTSLAAQRPSPSSSTTCTSRPLPSDPHALLGPDTPTFPRAVGLYRALLVSATTNPPLRREMGSAAHLAASRRSWFGAMETLVDGYRELVAETLELSRTSTIEFDIVCDAPAPASASASASATGDPVEESTAPRVPPRQRLVSRLGGVLGRRTGGRIREASISLPPWTAWLAPRTRSSGVAVEPFGAGGGIARADKPPQALLVRVVELAVLFLFMFLSVRCTAGWESLSSMRSLAA